LRTGGEDVNNTLLNLQPWGAKENKIGNNPLVMAIPRQEKHIVLDMAGKI